MNVYICLIALTLLVVAFLGQQYAGVGYAQNIRTPVHFCVFFVLLIWCSVYALRYKVGTDFGTYYASFNRIVDNNISIVDFVNAQRDYLFAYLEVFCAKLFNGSWIIFSYICALLTYVPVVAVARKKSIDFESTLLLFIFTMQYFSGFNGIRQGIAVSIVLYAYYCGLAEGKYIKYAVLMLVAFGFHSTVLVALPIHLLSLKKTDSWLFKIVVVAMLFSYVTLWDLWQNLIAALETLGQSKLATDYANVEATAHGSSLLRFIVALIPVLLGFVYKNKITEKYSDANAELVLITIAAIFSLFSMKYWIFSRVGLYFSISLILFIPKLECIFSENSKMFGKILILTLYFLNMCLLLLHGEGNLLPYQFIQVWG